jgi:DNA-binding NtrC family response regulator
MNMSASVANRRILIIDDTASIHQDFREVLCQDQGGEISVASIKNVLFGAARPERQTFEIDSACQGREALNKLSEYISLLPPELSTGTAMRRIVIF